MKRLFGEFTKVEPQDDGTIKVLGIASSETPDAEGEVITASAMKAAIPDYMRFGAVREMHQPSAAGTALGIEVDATGVTHFEALIVDPVAIKKVQTGVYKGFSIGGRVPPGGRDAKNKSRINALKLVEVSLVDRPCNPDATIQLVKLDGDANTETTMDQTSGETQTTPGDDVTKAETPPADTTSAAPPVSQVEGAGSEPEPSGGTAPAPAGDAVAKAGARFSKATKAALKAVHEKIAACHDELSKLGYADAEEGEDSDAPDDGAKDDAKGDDKKQMEPTGDLAKRADELTKRALDAEEKLAKVEAALAEANARLATKGAVMAVPVTKGADVAGSQPAPVEPAEGTPERAAFDLKKSWQQPQRIIG